MNLNSLYQSAPPWLLLHVPSKEDLRWLPSFLYKKADSSPVIRRLRGDKMRSRQGLMDEFGAALQFSESFGENWHALKEVLCYMDEWLEGEAYILVVTRPLDLLSLELGDELLWFRRTVEEVGEWWSHPITNNDRFNREAVPFHVIFRCERSELALVRERFGYVPLLEE
jgi:Barstar (barnase inhibitor)